MTTSGMCGGKRRREKKRSMTWQQTTSSAQRLGLNRLNAMARKLALLGLAAVIGSAAAGSVSLTEDTFDKEVFDSGKNAFIKFQAPW